MADKVKVVEIDSVRETLIELLKEADSKAHEVMESRQLAHPFEVWDIEADHLIAHGVTVQEWISVKDRLPEEEWESWCAENDWDVYPCLAVIKNKRGGRYVTKLFFTGENFVDDEYIRYTAQVTHWMPLPPAPEDLK